jgi:DNA topoisomerase-1
VRGEAVKLNDEQEEMAVAWAKKAGTPYVEDSIFKENFHRDFSEKLGMNVLPGDVDYSEVLRVVEYERAAKANLPAEERKRQVIERKEDREKHKKEYGWATVDGESIEIGNYTVEPNSIFMGRGQHPKRGSWKEGPREEDIELNLSPDADEARSKLGALGFRVVWDPNSIWIARWKDKLSGKLKYVWPSDASFLKQRKDIEKFEKAEQLKEKLDAVKAHIEANLTAENLRRRRTATVCYLIDQLKFRVGDEKDDEDEADTVGASTLRPEHLCFNGDGSVTFNFLGKDSIPLNITAELPPMVVDNLRDFAEGAGDGNLFEGVNSAQVGDFLKEVMEGLSAKVFRTLYATEAVSGRLSVETVELDDPDYVKRQAALRANLEAAIVCNHKRTIPKTWAQSLRKKKDRLKQLREKATVDDRAMRRKLSDEERRYRERLASAEEKLSEAERKQDAARAQLEDAERQGKEPKNLRKRLESARKMAKASRERVRKLKNDYLTSSQRLRKRLDERRQRSREAVEKMRLQVEAQEITRDYNLGTSLKNYIDPRVYLDWGRRVGYDWKNYYPTTLQRKFSWLDKDEKEEEE